ncbi:MAG: antibiotic biosynthesis monooxygenase family protein [Gemmatimonadales bacterium]
MFTIVWRFETPPEQAEEFEEMYGPEGDWARLFRRAEGYLGTELYRGSGDRLTWITVDRWVSRVAFEAFRTRYPDEYAALDVRGERLTRSEQLLGTTED